MMMMHDNGEVEEEDLLTLLARLFRTKVKNKNTESNITWSKSQTCSPFTNIAEELNWKLPRTHQRVNRI